MFKCYSAVNRLRRCPARSGKKKVRIIRKILADDREIRIITEPWMAELSSLMNSAGTERKLSRVYGANQ
ncbi:flagellar protein FliT [Undibacterium arcticum]